MQNLQDQVALVIGGGRGIGRALSHELAAQGAAVVVDDLYKDENGSASELVAEEIRKAGGRALALNLDCTTAEGGEEMVACTIAEFGKLDILIPCAGNFPKGALHEVGDDAWDLTQRLHVRGTYIPVRAALPHMRERNYGRILMIASRGAFMQMPPSKEVPRDEGAIRAGQNVAYSAAKAALLGFANSLAFETWETGITVNALIPSATTQLFPGTAPRKVGGIPVSISLDPSYIAPTVAFLCSPAAGNLSGKIVYASGGDVLVFSDPLNLAGSRMLRKDGRWTHEELENSLLPLLGIPLVENA